MSQRADEIRKRIASRRKQFDYDKKRQKPAAYDHYDYSEETLDKSYMNLIRNIHFIRFGTGTCSYLKFWDRLFSSS